MSICVSNVENKPNNGQLFTVLMVKILLTTINQCVLVVIASMTLRSTRCLKKLKTKFATN